MQVTLKKIAILTTILAAFATAETENLPNTMAASYASVLKDQWAILKNRDVESSLKTVVSYELTRKDLITLDPNQTEFPPMDVEGLVLKALSSKVAAEVTRGVEFLLDSDETRKIDYIASEEVWKKFFSLMRTFKPLTLNKVKEKIMEWPSLPEKSTAAFYDWVVWESSTLTPIDKKSFSLDRLFTLGDATQPIYVECVEKLNALNDIADLSPQLQNLLTKLASRIADPSRNLITSMVTYAALGNSEAFYQLSKWYEQPKLQELIFYEMRLSLLDPMVPNDYKDDFLNLIQQNPEYGMLLFSMAQSEADELNDFALQRLKASPASIVTDNMVKLATRTLYETKKLPEATKKAAIEVLRLNPLLTNNEVWISLLHSPEAEIAALSVSVLKNLPPSRINDQKIAILLRLMNEEAASEGLAKEILNEWAERNVPVFFETIRRLGLEEKNAGDIFARGLMVRYLPEYFAGKATAPILLARNLRQMPLERAEDSLSILRKTKPSKALVSPIIELLSDDNYRATATDLLTEWNTQEKNAKTPVVSELLWSRVIPLYASLKKNEAAQRALVDSLYQIKPKDKTGARWTDLLDHSPTNETRTLVLGKIRRAKATDALKRRLKNQLFATDAEHIENVALLLKHWSVDKTKALSSQSLIRKAQGLLLQDISMQQDAAVKLLELVGYNPLAKPPLREYYRALLDATLSKNDTSALSATRLLGIALNRSEDMKFVRGLLTDWMEKSLQKDFTIQRMSLALTKLTQEKNPRLRELLSDEMAELVTRRLGTLKSEEVFRVVYRWGSKIIAAENGSYGWLQVRALDFPELRTAALKQLKSGYADNTLRSLPEDSQKKLAQVIGTTFGKDTNGLFSNILRSQLRLHNLAAKLLFEKVALQDLEANTRMEALLILQESHITDEQLVKTGLFDILDSATQPLEIKGLASLFLMSRYLTAKESEQLQTYFESDPALQSLVSQPTKIFEQHEPQGIYTLKELNQPAWYSAGALRQAPAMGTFINRSRQVAEEWVKGFIRSIF